jgi:hypothetical protein
MAILDATVRNVCMDTMNFLRVASVNATRPARALMRVKMVTIVHATRLDSARARSVNTISVLFTGALQNLVN